MHKIQKSHHWGTENARDYAQSIIDTVREPLIVLDKDLRVMSASRSFYRTFQVSKAETENQYLFALGNGQWNIPALHKLLTAILPRHDVMEGYEVDHIFPSVGRRIMCLNARRINDRKILLAMEDITERKRSENLMKVEDRRKTEFLATLAHELRNPLAPIQNGIQILSAANDKPELIAPVCEIMSKQLHHLTRLIDDLMDISRINEGKIKLRLEPVDAVTVAREAIEEAHPLISEKHHEIIVRQQVDALCVMADHTRLNQIIVNLLNNAAKYTDEGGKIILSLTAEGNEAVIRVYDNGIGIEAEKLSQIFDLFMQVESGFERAHAGLGIGLSLVKRLTEMHGGSVEAYSEGVGKGSEFTLRLPLLKVEKPIAPAAHHANQPQTSPYRILVVDDNEASAKTLGWVIEALGHEAKLTRTGRQALKEAKSFRPQVILLDIGLPDMNGYEVCQALRKDSATKDSIIIAQTGWGQKEHRQLSKEAGFDYHLVKPIDMQALQELLASETVR